MIDEQERQQMIDAMLDQLENGSVADRRAAAYYLGEAAAGEAVDGLIKAYHEDTNRSVRRAAAYSLGMFRAVEKALKAGREPEVVELLRHVEEEGQLGTRAPVGRWIRIILGLLVALVALAALNLVSNNIKVALFPSLARDRVTVAREVQSQFTPIRNDVNTLQSQFVGVVVNGGDLDCTAYFNDPPPINALPSLDSLVHTDLAALINRMNGVRDSLVTTRTIFNEACFGAAPLTREAAGAVYRDFVPTITTIGELDAALISMIENAPTPTPIPPTPRPATETPIPPTGEPATAAPQVQPTLDAPLPEGNPIVPTVPNFSGESDANPSRHLPALYAIVDTVTSTRGASSLLLRYWQDVQTSGDTDGCSASRPGIPETYTVLPEIDLQTSPEFSRAVTLINNGLNALRDGWREFQSACSAGNMLGSVQSGIAFAQAADSAFEAAVPLLDRVRANS